MAGRVERSPAGDRGRCAPRRAAAARRGGGGRASAAEPTPPFSAVSSDGAVKYADVIPEHELAERLRHYYTRYYRDTLGIPDWAAHVAHREAEDRHERARLPRLRALVGDALARGPVLT